MGIFAQHRRTLTAFAVGLIGILAIALAASAAGARKADRLTTLEGTIWVANRGAHTIRGFDALSRNTVHYTGIDCSGHWTYLTRKGGSYQFREVITSGKGGKCKGVGRVTLTRVDPEHVRYVFRGGGVVSRGVLGRVR